MATVSLHADIVSNPEIHEGRPCLAGTGLTVHEIVARWQRGLSVEEVRATAPHLALRQIRSALAYYEDHRDEIDADFVADETLYDRLADEAEFDAATWNSLLG